MLWTSGWFNLKSTNSFAVYNANTPRNIVKMRAGTIPKDHKFLGGFDTRLRRSPTTAMAFGNDSIPLLTTSAIISRLTNYRDAEVVSDVQFVL